MEALILYNGKLSQQLSETNSALRECGEEKSCLKYVLEHTRSSTENFMTKLDKSRSVMEGYGPIYGTQDHTLRV